jgi:hypothetical protein
MGGQQQCYSIIVTRIAIEDNFVFHRFCLWWPYTILSYVYLCLTYKT